MPSVLDQLPDDVESLKALVVDHAARNEQLQSQVAVLQEQLTLALAKRFASRSEQLSQEQIRLFDEAESTSTTDLGEETDDAVEVALHRRSKGSRKPLPSCLPRIDFVHELPEGERRCDHD